MSNENMEAKLGQLECLFTWGVEKLDIRDLNSLPDKLFDRIQFCPQKYHATYFNILAFISHLKGETESALDYLQKAESALREDKRKKTDFLVTFSSFAWIHYHLRKLDGVEDYLEKVKSICKDIPGSSDYSCSLPVVHGEKAWSFLRLGVSFYEQAKESFSKALEAEPDNMSFNVGYAIVLYRLEGMNKDRKVRAEESGTVAQLRKALSLEPTNTEIMVLLALKLQNSRRQEAQNLIKEALRLSPDVPQVTRYVAKFFRAEGSIKESLSVLERAVEMSPNSSFLHHQIGLCHKQLLIQMFEERRPGRRIPAAQKAAKAAECIKHFSKAVELKPTNIYAQVNLAEAYGENRQFGEAEKIFTTLINDKSLSESDKQHCHTCYGLFLFYKKKDEDKAVFQFKVAYKIHVDSYDRKQAGKKLKQIAERNLNTKHKVIEASEILAFVSSEDKQDTQARDDLRRAQQHSSDTDELSETFAKGLRLKN
ncbi:interferon-induced protein with tetratricopeptide repeats 5-like isoform X1 [Myxocyprinus asiaticus]|uniref:interferon-induced protein with tetratricopeptide repeats 5-like isoform X1 n=1 Tax=Myxocyprinus asiaticus TaxID=70543 RepID=UPI002223186D|nr:interferon-induced protein with tetratricopeptide repeats 5-like isoform X1 [Myxocyprinus asiaticus]